MFLFLPFLCFSVLTEHITRSPTNIITIIFERFLLLLMLFTTLKIELNIIHKIFDDFKVFPWYFGSFESRQTCREFPESYENPTTVWMLSFLRGFEQYNSLLDLSSGHFLKYSSIESRCFASSTLELSSAPGLFLLLL